ncbi:MAG TPA: SelB C-terminal domain-containing protein [Acidimicrobiales bacterium]|nr:SelB C-terminal domain-containing protein [Acidimicrobiales bacterium]
MHVVATAGHVDHGKSSLVLALTGVDPDRWAEEKARGLTIDLGFAPGRVGDHDVSWVDVPGHVRFLRNMLAGVGAVDAVVLVVAATEGWKPQSEEHLRILAMLGVDTGVVALTKADLVDATRLDAATDEVRGRLAGTGLAGAPVVAVDSLSRRGLDDLAGALAALLAVTPTAADVGRPRLWVDRAFSARGAGTVVTGTLAGGALRVGDVLAAVGGGRAARAGRELRVRGLQVHGATVTEAAPGTRVALNLVGAARDEIGRGDALVRPGQWAPTRRADASLQVLDALDHAVSRRGAYALYAGTAEHPVGVRILGPDAIEAGASGLVRLHLPVPVPWLPGDRYVLREQGRGETIGGGLVLDVDPVLPASRARPSIDVGRVVAERGWVDAELLGRLTGERVAPDVGRFVVDPAARAAALDRLAEQLASAGELGLEVAGLDERQRALLADLTSRTPDLEVRDGWARRRAARDERLELHHPWLDALEATPWAPPAPHEHGVPRPLLRQLQAAGRVVERDGIWWSAAAVDAAAGEVARLLEGSPDGITVAQVRDALGSSRKHVLPLLSLLDATGVTRRRGELRVGGPRLPAARPTAAGDDAGRA